MISDSPNTLTNFNGEDGWYPSLPISQDPFATIEDRCSIAEPMTPAESEAFFTAAERYTGPRLLAYRGYIPWSDARAYYRDEAGNWLDTADDTPWPGALAETFNTAWKAKFDLRGK